MALMVVRHMGRPVHDQISQVTGAPLSVQLGLARLGEVARPMHEMGPRGMDAA